MDTKHIYSTYLSEYALDDATLKRLQRVELGMLRDFDKVAKANNLQYMLSGGSVLGAIRHGGFIPWDDDIDLMMYREDYDKLDKAFQEMFPDKYTVVSNDSDKKFVGKAKKIYLKNTIFDELETENYPEEKGIFLDVFPIDNIPNGKLTRKIRGIIHDFSMLATGAIYCHKYPSTTLIEKGKTIEEVKKFYNKKRRIGGFLSIFFGFRFYMNIEKKMANYRKKTNYEGIPTGIRYNREVFEKGFFGEVKYVTFEGEEYPIPARYEEYLTNLYGDYMAIPPVEKREIHVASRLEFGEYGEQDE